MSVSPVPGTLARPATAYATNPPLIRSAVGARPSDTEAVHAVLQQLRGGPSGAMLVDKLLAAQARIAVLDDSEFAQRGISGARAAYDSGTRTILVRRSDLSDVARHSQAVLAIAHEGAHLLDDLGNLAAPMRADAERRIAQAGGTTTPEGQRLTIRARTAMTLVSESRAFVFAGSVARELGIPVAGNDPTHIAASGGATHASLAAVWQALLDSPYNPHGLALPVLTY